MTLAGTLRLAADDDNVTTWPPTGAGSANVTVPVVPKPPVTLEGVNVRLAGTTGRTFTVPVTVVPFATADIVADLGAVATAVVTANVAVVEPAETVTDAGTEMPVVLLDNATTSPPTGAGPTNVTVPVAF